ncbi:TRAP transporter substrate-binding protein [Amphritea sp. 2_MG-2023]|jgi:TRAP-type C4-dicarboxylate transport system substrate-binding protein|uniref:TRAP transporter substrate-binding protein n=1 Tax=Amphritea TaxID=515417 RepID=UPI001C076F99|nr:MULTISPECIES: TRAP transporter substrate-binding protein [Amphritea]MBU2965371.1 TRAP transporter substrate-binding protein [Amphritea atlantica]MDO6420016.1 TRAP transporter substrate-binding protein [Amphritea sp. 2_MG-2023]MDX2424129.1 TRAP transporter substrate-binding protein [Amphritea sp.]
MKYLIKRAAVLCASVMMLGSSGVATAASQWHMPTPYGDANLPTKIAYQFAEEIKSKTAGELDIVVHSGASLIKHPEIPRAVKTGQVQLGEVFIGIMGNTHPVFKHDNIPFLATSFDSAEKLWKAAKPEVEKQLNKEGMMLLYTVAWPAQSLYTKAPVNSLADLEGLKMRAYSPSTSRLADLMNTSPTTVQVPEIPQAFSTGIIDAMITSPSTGVNGQAWDYLSHYTDIRAWIPKNIVVVNKRAFKRLDKATQAVILAAAANAEAKGWLGVRAKAEEDTKTLADNGIVVTEPSAELMSELNKIGATMIDEWKAEAPEIETILANFKQ